MPDGPGDHPGPDPVGTEGVGPSPRPCESRALPLDNAPLRGHEGSRTPTSSVRTRCASVITTRPCVRLAGFEPATSWPPATRATAAPQPGGSGRIRTGVWRVCSPLLCLFATEPSADVLTATPPPVR